MFGEQCDLLKRVLAQPSLQFAVADLIELCGSETTASRLLAEFVQVVGKLGSQDSDRLYPIAREVLRSFGTGSIHTNVLDPLVDISSAGCWKG